MPILILLLFVFTATAAELPVPSLSTSPGLNVFFRRGAEADLDLIAAAGFKVLRRDFAWQETETERGKYDFSAYDEMLGNMEKRGMRPLYILDYSNPLYEPDGASPQTPESIQAFATWAAAAATHFRGRHVMWEIWNEPNFAFWKPTPDARQYANLLIATAKALRAADPATTIVGPAVPADATAFIDAVFKAGILPYLDAVSLHFYSGSGPEGATADFDKVRRLMARYNQGKVLPIVSSELGWSTFHGSQGVEPEVQAQYLVRLQLWGVASNIPFINVFSWTDRGTATGEREANYGIMTADKAMKPAYAALVELTREMTGFRFVRRVEVAGKGDWALVFRNGQNQTKIVVWTEGAPHRLRLPGATENVDVSGMPKYLSGRGLNL